MTNVSSAGQPLGTRDERRWFFGEFARVGLQGWIRFFQIREVFAKVGVKPVLKLLFELVLLGAVPYKPHKVRIVGRGSLPLPLTGSAVGSKRIGRANDFPDESVLKRVFLGFG